MPVFRVPEQINIKVEITFGKLVIEHIETKRALDQATLDKMDTALGVNNEGIKDAQKDDVK